ncbi:eCIS core domain-containing protein [Roseobacteraceae bacterium S113]
MGEAKLKTKAPVRRPPPVPLRQPAAMVLAPALRVGAVNDPAEREAETMAARVVGASAPQLAAPPTAPQRPKAAPLRRSEQPNTDSLTPEPVPAEQADFELPKTQDVATDGLSPADTDELNSGTPTDTGGDAPNPEGDLAASSNAATVGRMGGLAPSDVSQRVANPGPGRPLPAGLRARVEPHFQTSFADVRLHTTKADQEAASRIGARAFTHKNHIWLGPGESETNTRLMAHELTHVVQQTRGAETLPISRMETPTIRRAGWLAGKAEKIARNVPGYTLITVLVGKQLFSGDRVSMTGKNLLGGLFGLIPGGTAIFDQLDKTGAIDDAFTWVKTQLSQLNLTWSRISNTLDQLYDGLMSFSPIKNAKRILGGLVSDILTFVGRITTKVLEFVMRAALKLAGPYADKIWGILKQAGDVVALIVKNPLGFALNLVKSVVGGFVKFGRNIVTHLKNGILGWLFGALTSAGIELPAKLDFKGLMSLVMQILGLTYANFRARLVKKLGPSGEKKVAMIEKSVSIVKILLKEGFAGIWKKMIEMIDKFKETLLGGMSEMVITTVIRAGLSWLAGLSNPVGAVIKVVLAIYDLIVAFLERLDQIMEVAQAIFGSIGAIARGQTGKAIDFVEKVIGKSVPVVISFLAAALGLGGISKKITGIIKRLQKPVIKAMDKLITFVMKKAKKLFSKLIKKLNGKRKLPSVSFQIGTKSHRIFAAKKGKALEVKVASTPRAISVENRYLQSELQHPDLAKDKIAQKIGQAIATAAQTAQSSTQPTAAATNTASAKKNNRGALKKLTDEMTAAKKTFAGAQTGIDQNPFISEVTDGSGKKVKSPALFRASEPRLAEIEGAFGTHADLTRRVGKEIPGSSRKYSQYYDIDHVMEKQFAKIVLANLHYLDKRGMRVATTPKNTPADQKKPAPKGMVRRTGIPKPFGFIGRNKVKKSQVGLKTARNNNRMDFRKIDEAGSHLPAIALFHRNHIKNNQKVRVSPAKIIANARRQKLGARQGYARKQMIAQLNFEVEKITARMSADNAASQPIRDKVQQGLKQAVASNQKLYTLDATQLNEPQIAAAGTPGTAPGDAKFSKSETPMFKTPGVPGPDFAALEGTVLRYGSRGSILKGSAGQLESDHTIDKAMPLNAQNAPMVETSDRDTVRAKVRALNTAATGAPDHTQDQLDRMKRLFEDNEPLFPRGSGMGSYTERDGIAIAIHRTLAKRVTAQTRLQPNYGGLTAARASARKLDETAQWVYGGDAHKPLADVRKAIWSSMKGTFTKVTNAHSNATAAEYQKEINVVTNAHPAELKGHAKKAMMGIATRVSASLKRCNSKTADLFTNTPYSAP